MEPEVQFAVEAGDPVRLDAFLAERLPLISRLSLRKLIAAGNCTVDGQPRTAGYRLNAGQVITMKGADRMRIIPPESIPLTVLLEDEFLLAIDKPSGMLVHPTAAERTGTVSNALQHRFGGRLRFTFPHRLDRQTSGLLLAAKTRTAAAAISHAFAARQVEKEYAAVVSGAPLEQMIEMPIGRSPLRTPQWNVDLNGRPAQTSLQAIEQRNDFALVRLIPYTGRTNQLRIHCAAIGHPIVGDTAYGGVAGERLLLHALKLRFRHPATGRVCDVAAPLPREFG